MPVVTDFAALIFDNAALRWNNERSDGTPVVVTYNFRTKSSAISRWDLPTLANKRLSDRH